MYPVCQRWLNVPGLAFPRSRVSGILGMRVHGHANFIQECERKGKLNLRSCEEITQLWCGRGGEERWKGGIVDKIWVWPQTGFPPVYLYTMHSWPGGLWVARWQVDPAHLIRPYTYSTCVMSCTPTPHIRSLTQEQRNAKQKCRSTGERKKMLYRNAGTWNAKEKSRNAGTRESKGPQGRMPISAVCRTS